MMAGRVLSVLLLLVCASPFLAGCAPHINAGNQNMVTVVVYDPVFEGEALNLADAHCQKYGKSANLRRPRGEWGTLYDYSCVK